MKASTPPARVAARSGREYTLRMSVRRSAGGFGWIPLLRAPRARIDRRASCTSSHWRRRGARRRGAANRTSAGDHHIGDDHLAAARGPAPATSGHSAPPRIQSRRMRRLPVGKADPPGAASASDGSVASIRRSSSLSASWPGAIAFRPELAGDKAPSRRSKRRPACCFVGAVAFQRTLDQGSAGRRE
jgi:hypothetical protein